LSMGAAAASPAATSPVNIKALLILASFVELCRLLAVAARERAHRPIDHGSSVRQLAFPGHGSPILGACDDPSLFIEALIYKQRKQKNLRHRRIVRASGETDPKSAVECARRYLPARAAADHSLTGRLAR
jgi:hypothetical protein